jgi:tight adherence protein C
MDRFQDRRLGRSDQVREGPSDRWEAIQIKLSLAGNPYNWAPSDYLGTKLFAAGGLGAGLFLLLTLGHQPVMAFVFLAVGAAIGWFGPDLLLRSKTQSRQKEIRLSLPDALDLLVISVEAGLGFDAAIQRLVEKKDNRLTREFARVLAELRVGRSRRDALKDMVQRTQVPDLTNFVGALLQAESLGVSVTRVLTVQADQMRTIRRQRAEETAARLQLKMLFPLAFFIFPALCVVIIGPIWPQVATANAPGL